MFEAFLAAVVLSLLIHQGDARQMDLDKRLEKLEKKELNHKKEKPVSCRKV